MKMFLTLIIFILFSSMAFAKPPSEKRSKFYDFNEQLINGEIKKPTALYTSAREKVRFDRLLSLKKSFLSNLFRTHKMKIFK